MSLLTPIVSTDPASPRLTVYDETAGTRMEFSGVTLENWANKIANMLVEEFEFDDPSAAPTIVVDLPISWQAAVLPIGIYNAGLTFTVSPGAGSTNTDTSNTNTPNPNLVFTTVDRVENWQKGTDVVVVSNDPFGRGVTETGGTLPPGIVDFGPTVRFYGDQYFGDSPELADWSATTGGESATGTTAKRILIPTWTSREEFDANVMAPLAAGGSVVVIAGMASADRIEQIAEAEKVTARRA